MYWKPFRSVLFCSESHLTHFCTFCNPWRAASIGNTKCRGKIMKLLKRIYEKTDWGTSTLNQMIKLTNQPASINFNSRTFSQICGTIKKNMKDLVWKQSSTWEWTRRTTPQPSTTTKIPIATSLLALIAIKKLPRLSMSRI